MQKNVFKIYDGRNNFWQWDKKQKLIVLDDEVTEVHFSNRNMTHSIKRAVYEDKDGNRVCNVPDDLLKIPRNLVAYAYADGATVKSVKFAVVQRPMPSDYISDASEELYDVERRLELLEAMLKDIELGKQEMHKFESLGDASAWAKENNATGVVVVVRVNGKWIAHVVEDDYSITPICDSNGDMVEIELRDGGDADGYREDELVEVCVWDGGGAAGI